MRKPLYASTSRHLGFQLQILLNTLGFLIPILEILNVFYQVDSEVQPSAITHFSTYILCTLYVRMVKWHDQNKSQKNHYK